LADAHSVKKIFTVLKKNKLLDWVLFQFQT
jgi:hypothetical protein